MPMYDFVENEALFHDEDLWTMSQDLGYWHQLATKLMAKIWTKNALTNP